MKNTIVIILLLLFTVTLPLAIIAVEKNCEDLKKCRDSTDGCDADRWEGCWIECKVGDDMDCIIYPE